MLRKRNLLNDDKAVTTLDASASFVIVIILIVALWSSAQHLYTPQLTASEAVQAIDIFEAIASNPGVSSDGSPGIPEDPNLIKKFGVGTNLPLVYGTLQLDNDGEISQVLRRYTYNGYTWPDMYSCFLEGTQVVMADGSYKNIENIEIGELVKSYDEETGEVVDGTVTSIFHHSADEMTDYYMIINNDLKVTPNHRFYSNGQWVEASELKIGDPLFNPSEEYIVNSIEKIYEKVPTYNFEVEGSHNYFIKMDTISNDIEPMYNTDILVHNDGVAPGAPFINGELNPIEGVAESYQFGASDGDPGDNLGFRIDWGDGSDIEYIYNVAPGVWSPSISHTWTVSEVVTDTIFTISVRAFDSPPNSQYGPTSTFDVDVQGIIEANFTAYDTDGDGPRRWVIIDTGNSTCGGGFYSRSSPAQWDFDYNSSVSGTDEWFPTFERDPIKHNYPYDVFYSWPWYQCCGWCDGEWGSCRTFISDPWRYGLGVGWHYEGENYIPEYDDEYTLDYGPNQVGMYIGGRSGGYATPTLKASNLLVKTVNVYWDQPPVADYSWEDSDLGGMGTEITFDAGNSYDDGIYNMDPGFAGIVTYQWDFNYDVDSGFSVDATGEVVDHEEYPPDDQNPESDYKVALRVIDTAGQVSEIVVETVRARQDTPCEPNFIWCDKDGAGPDTTLYFDASSTTIDSDKFIFAYWWYMTWHGGPYDVPGGLSPYANWTYLDSEEQKATLHVFNNAVPDGYSGVSKFVRPYAPPIFSWDDADGYGPGTIIILDASASNWFDEDDMQHAPNNYRWDFNYDDGYDDPGWFLDWQDPIFEWNFSDYEPHNVALAVYTSNLETPDPFDCVYAIYNTTVQAKFNALPIANFSWWDEDGVIGDGTNIIFDASSSSDDDGIVLYEWDFNYDGWFVTDNSSTSPSMEYDIGNINDYHVALRVHEGAPLNRNVTMSQFVKAGQSAQAIFTWYDIDGIGPDVTINFNASNSTSVYHPINYYYWDWDGTGSIEEGSVVPTITHNYTGELDHGVFDENGVNKHHAILLVCEQLVFGFFAYFGEDVQAYEPKFNWMDEDYSGVGTNIIVNASESALYLTLYNVSWNISRVEWDWDYTIGSFNAVNWSDKNSGNFTFEAEKDYLDEEEHTVALRLWDDSNTQSKVVYQTVQANPVSPFNASFTWEDADGDGFGTTINFYASTNLTIEEEQLIGINYSWDWITDGLPYDLTTPERNVSHDYNDTDAHYVTLRVTDAAGNSRSIWSWVQASVYPEDEPWLTDGEDTYWNGVLSKKELTLPTGPDKIMTLKPITGYLNMYSYIIYQEKSSKHITLDYNAIFDNLRGMDYDIFMKSIGLDTYSVGVGLTFECLNPVTNRNEIVKYGISPNVKGMGQTITRDVTFIKKPVCSSPTAIIRLSSFPGTVTVNLIEYITPQDSHPPNIPDTPIPPDGENGVATSSLALSVNVSDPDGENMTVSFYNGVDHSLIGTVGNVWNQTGENTTTSYTLTYDLQDETQYWWYVIVDDGIFQITSDTWSFVTRSSSGDPIPDVT